MLGNKNIFVIIGSASQNSANQKLIDNLAKLMQDNFQFTICPDLKTLPHFDPELSYNNPPEQIVKLRNKIDEADGILICTPEYVFSIPSGLKNVIEWCIATTIFSKKPTGLITASANGEKGHEELQLIMKTALANFSTETTLLIEGVKGKIDQHGQIIDKSTFNNLNKFANAFRDLVIMS